MELLLRKEIFVETTNVNSQIEPISQNFKRRRNYNSYALSESDHELIAELDSASSIFEDERTLPVIGQMDTKVDAFNWPAIYSGRIVHFCKQINAFNWLNSNNQLAVLKQFFMYFLTVRIASNYDIVTDGYFILAVRFKNTVITQYCADFAAT